MNKRKSLTNIYKASLLIVIFLVYTIFVPSTPDLLKIGIDAIVLGLALYLFKDDLMEDALIFKKNIKTNIKWIIIAFISILIIQAFSGALLDKMFGILPPSRSGQLSLLKQAPLYLFFSMLVFSPIIEELTFRKSFRQLFKNNILYVLISSIIYGTLYVVFSAGESVSYFFIISYSLIAMIYPLLYLKTDNIYAPMILHIFQNVFALILLLAI